MSAGRRFPRFSSATLGALVRRLDRSVLGFQISFEVRRRLRRRRHDLVLPSALYVETSSFCRAACDGCYVPVADRRRELRLDDGLLRKLLDAVPALNLDYICIVGGEPLDPSIAETNLRLVREQPRQRFLICTGAGPGVEIERFGDLAQVPNLSLIISFDGGAQTHDRIRGAGSHRRCLEAAHRFGGEGRGLCGASVTLRPENWREATGADFLRHLHGAGVSYFVFDPIETADCEPGLSPEQYAAAVRRLMARSRQVPTQIFANPFGQLLGERLGPWQPMPMRTLAVDYRGEVYLSRRGPSFGNLGRTALDEFLVRPDVQRAYGGRPRRLGPQDNLFAQTLVRLRPG